MTFVAALLVGTIAVCVLLAIDEFCLPTTGELVLAITVYAALFYALTLVAMNLRALL